MISVCVQTSPSGWNWGGCSTPFIASISGRISCKQSGSIEQFEAAARAAFGEDARQFVADAFGRDAVDQRASGGWRRMSPARFEAEPRGETDGAQQPQMVFAETRRGIADGADDARFEVGAAADEVEDLAGTGSSSRALMVKSRRTTSSRGSVSNFTPVG